MIQRPAGGEERDKHVRTRAHIGTTISASDKIFVQNTKMHRQAMVEVKILSPRVKTKSGTRRMNPFEYAQYVSAMDNLSKQRADIAQDETSTFNMTGYNQIVNGSMARGASLQSETTADLVRAV